MKRSEINDILRDAEAFFESKQFKLPPFARWSPEDWKTKDKSYQEIIDNMLGWDITDFSSGDFHNEGLLLFTLRNGNPHMYKYTKTYAEKVLLIKEGQVTPFHFHWNKMEDIINRGGGNLVIEVYQADDEEAKTDKPVTLYLDGRQEVVEPGHRVVLTPGESITLMPYQYHAFWAEEGKGPVLAGEVSQVNDDHSDNRFLVEKERFSDIEEDVEPLYLLCSDYEKFLQRESEA